MFRWSSGPLWGLHRRVVHVSGVRYGGVHVNKPGLRVDILPASAAPGCLPLIKPRGGRSEEKEEEEVIYIWEIGWIFIPPPLQTCVQDGEGARAAGSRAHRERHLGGETVIWEKGNSGIWIRFYPASQSSKVSLERGVPLGVGFLRRGVPMKTN